MEIHGKKVGKDSPCFIIAEAGVNHNGSLDLAIKLVDAAVDSGADAVKFQTFRANRLATPCAAKAAYQKDTTDNSESQFEMLRRLELTKENHVKIMEHCKKREIIFLSTPFDEKSVDFLIDIGLKCLKIPSGEVTNLPFLRHIGAICSGVKGSGTIIGSITSGVKASGAIDSITSETTGSSSATIGTSFPLNLDLSGCPIIPIILSTGMSTLQEVKEAVGVLQTSGTPLSNIAILHCTTQYPTPFEGANLKAISTISKHFPSCTTGFSDHTPGISCAIAAVALGASIIEKHFTLDCTLEGPDHKASIEPEALSNMIRSIREVESALGNGCKKPAQCEHDNIAIARKYVVASRPIKKGETFTPENLTIKRTGEVGVSPMLWDTLIGSIAIRPYMPDEPVSLP
ncbi:N-acetylneuraminate synthase [Desulfamplus magnetovallimortis]|uniref:N-acetylneuraminate synthase n=1 Tax=Desulfamplus magnetovallimortis TaxID=1246637 RepID=A0A1W1HF00_9BACT|nr:N-acetylneuraminate synthase family protein [Desulfamplus magnetovallimortis]SLM30978.1 N-acetylneuraminate synthase [Desulfamplus magnetovallimortis]